MSPNIFNKTLSILAVSLMTLSVGLTLNSSSIKTYAQTNNSAAKEFAVNATKGVFVRNNKCAKVGSQRYGSLVSQASNKTITCTIKGVSYKMINVNLVFGNVNTNDAELYIASKFVSPLITNDKLTSTKYKVNNTRGLNLRNANCKRITTVANGTIVDQPKDGMGGTISLCRVGNQFYEMTDIVYQGKAYKVAKALLVNA